jgi:hypothetical protein
MEHTQVTVYLSWVDLFILLILFIGAVASLVVLVGAVLRVLIRPNDRKRRLRQIQIDKDLAQLELTKLTQDFVQRAKQYAQDQQLHQNGERNPTRANRKWKYQE